MGRNFNILAVLGVVAGVAVLVGSGSKTFVNYNGGNTRLGSNYPRGVRNNNAGNLRITPIKWKNKIPKDKNTDGSFEQFYTYTDGVRALMIDVKSKIVKYKTIGAILAIYAPVSENNTAAYITQVERKTGINRNTILTPNESTIKALTRSIIEVENGKAYYNDSIINTAFKSL